MQRILFSLVLVCMFSGAQCQDVASQYTESFTIEVSNPLNALRTNSLVTLSPEQIKKKAPKFNAKAFVVFLGAVELPSQYNANDPVTNGIAFVLPELKARETVKVTIRYAKSGELMRTYPKKTQAEISHKTGGQWQKREYIGGHFQNVNALRVPPEHKDHSWFIRYEGPGWESDQVGYRFYLDQRNATDVFGKLTSEMVLQNVGQEGFDSYHELQPWGMDVMKVGKSLGIGSIGYLVGGKAIRVEKTDSVSCTITSNGVVQSSILTNYYGWNLGDKKTTLASSISIHQGTRLTQQTLTFKDAPAEIATGIVKDTLAAVIKSKGDATHFGYLATYGKQSLNNDNLGLAVFFDSSDLVGFTTDDQSNIISLKVKQNRARYFFMAAWEKEVGGIADEKAFKAYLEKVSVELANPVRVK